MGRVRRQMSRVEARQRVCLGSHGGRAVNGICIVGSLWRVASREYCDLLLFLFTGRLWLLCGESDTGEADCREGWLRLGGMRTPMDSGG